MGYVLAADTDEFNDCMVRPCSTLESAKICLAKFESAEDEQIRKEIAEYGYRNFHIVSTDPKDEWWNDPFLAN